MRYRMMATYRGVPYEVGVGPSNTDVVLFAACPPPEELGFEPATGHWRKAVIRAEIDALWESRPVGGFRGEPCMVLDDLGERLHIAYLGTDPERAANLGYWQVDRGVFELLAARDEVTGLTEERVDKPLHWNDQPDSDTTVPVYPYGTAPWPALAAPLADAQAPLADAQAPLADAEAAPAAGVPAGDGPPATPGEPPVPPILPAPPMASDWPAPGPEPGTGMPPIPVPATGPPSFPSGTGPQPAPVQPLPAPAGDGGGRSARRQRVPTREIFCELADLASIPRSAYALETETDGTMCLLPTPEGFEVFIAAGGARHEVRSFADEEAAYFYMFGVLAAEAVRNGSLAPAVGAASPPRGGI